ncbi:MAG: preprotein translocase subunit SecG [Opitutus sp.]|nr:preprotein translocase subunit SecG [Opitutus sp.]
MNLLIGIFTFVLILVSLFLVLVVLMQKAKSDGAVAALGSSGMESTFGAETGNVLSKATINAAILFFVLSFGLYLAQIYQSKHRDAADNKLPTVTAPTTTTPAPVTPPPTTNSEPKKP